MWRISCTKEIDLCYWGTLPEKRSKAIWLVQIYFVVMKRGPSFWERHCIITSPLWASCWKVSVSVFSLGSAGTSTWHYIPVPLATQNQSCQVPLNRNSLKDWSIYGSCGQKRQGLRIVLRRVPDLIERRGLWNRNLAKPGKGICCVLNLDSPHSKRQKITRQII